MSGEELFGVWAADDVANIGSWVGLIPSSKEIWERFAQRLEAIPETVRETVRQTVATELDSLIDHWREAVQAAEDTIAEDTIASLHLSSHSDMKAARLTLVIARCYVDAYQTARNNLLGELKP